MDQLLGGSQPLQNLHRLNNDLNGGIMMNEESALEFVTREGCTVLKVMLLVVDSFNKTKLESKDFRPTLMVSNTAKNMAADIFSKYEKGIISLNELYSEAAASGRRLYFNTTIGETNG